MSVMQDLPSVGELRGQIAVVTGASRGIGRAIALQLAVAGADVVVHAREHRAGAEEVAATIRGLGRQAQVLTCDLAVADRHEWLVETAWATYGQVNIWVNNAGVDVITGPPAERSFDEKLDQLWRVDVLATIRLSRLAGARFRQQATTTSAGVIVNVGWDQAAHGMGGESGEMFAAAKGAVMAFSRSLAESLAPQVRVNCVAPGWIKTAWGAQATEYWQRRACGEALLARWGTPEDVAAAVRFLVAPAASFVTGQILAVNGGFRYHQQPV